MQTVTQAGKYEGDEWEWDVMSLFATGSDIHANLMHELHAVLMQQRFHGVNCIYIFAWRHDQVGGFSVKSCYDHFKDTFSGPPLNNSVVKALSSLWKIKAPSKILFLGWRSIHKKIATIILQILPIILVHL